MVVGQALVRYVRRRQRDDSGVRRERSLLRRLVGAGGSWPGSADAASQSLLVNTPADRIVLQTFDDC